MCGQSYTSAEQFKQEYPDYTYTPATKKGRKKPAYLIEDTGDSNPRTRWSAILPDASRCVWTYKEFAIEFLNEQGFTLTEVNAGTTTGQDDQDHQPEPVLA